MKRILINCFDSTELFISQLRDTKAEACKWARIYGRAYGAYFYVYQVLDGRWTFDNSYDPSYLKANP